MTPGITKDNSKSTKWLLLVLLAALALRLVYLHFYNKMPEWEQLTVDNRYHVNWAMNIADGNVLGDTTYFRAPFYIYCLAALFKLTGYSLWTARIFGLLIGLASIALTYAIGRRLFNAATGLLAASIQSIYPFFLYLESELLLDMLFTLLCQLFVHRLLIWWDNQNFRHALLMGIFIGIAAITRPVALVFILPVLILIFAAAKRRTNALKPASLFLLGCALIVAPIFVRNLAVAGDPVLIASQGGINLYIGNNENADGLSAVLPEPLGSNWRLREIAHIAETDAGRTLKPGEVSAYWSRKALDWIQSNPIPFLKLYLNKLLYSVSNQELSNNRNLQIFFGRHPLLNHLPLGFGVIFPLAVLGLIAAGGFSKRVLFIALLFALFLIASALFFINSRFRLPILPYAILFGAAGICYIKELFSVRRRLLLAIIAVGAAVALPLLSKVTSPINPLCQHLMATGIHQVSAEDYQSALLSFRSCAELDPQFPEVNLSLGTAFIRLGKLDSAEIYLNREIALHPLRHRAYVNLASIYLLREQLDTARALAMDALEKQPWDLTANQIMLRIAFADHSLGEAQLDSIVAASASRVSNNVYFLNEAGRFYSEKQAYPSALAVLKRAAASSPPPVETDDESFERPYSNSLSRWNLQKAQAYYQLGFVEGVTGHFNKAVENSIRAIEIDSNLTEAYVNLISGYISMGQPGLAQTTLEKARRKFPTNPYWDKLASQL